MSSQRLAVPALVGASALGAVVYYSRGSSQNTSQQQKPNRHPAAGTRDEGISGAGVAGTAMTGGHDHPQPGGGGGDSSSKNRSPAPKESLPAGGVGGGVGAGGTSARAVSQPSSQPGPSGSYGADKSPSGGRESLYKPESRGSFNDAPTNQPGTESRQRGGNSGGNGGNGGGGGGSRSMSERLQGVFGQGGAAAAHKDEPSNKKKFEDPRVHSNHAETPTKNAAGNGKM